MTSNLKYRPDYRPKYSRTDEPVNGTGREAYDPAAVLPPERAPRGPNKTSKLLKHAIILAADVVGLPEVKRDASGNITAVVGTGQDGLVGYLRHLALNEPKSFASLLGRVLPLQVRGLDDAGDQPRRYKTVDELRAELKARGIPEAAIQGAAAAIGAAVEQAAESEDEDDDPE